MMLVFYKHADVKLEYQKNSLDLIQSDHLTVEAQKALVAMGEAKLIDFDNTLYKWFKLDVFFKVDDYGLDKKEKV